MAALKSPADEQLQQLKLVLASVGKSQWGKYLGLLPMLNKLPKNATEAYTQFVDETQPMNHAQFVRTLKGVIGIEESPISEETDALLKLGTLTKEPLAGICKAPFDGGILPVTHFQLKRMRAYFQQEVQRLNKRFGVKKPQSTFFLYNQPLRSIVGEDLLPCCGLDVLLAESQKKLMRPTRPAMPDVMALQAAGHSATQRIKTYVELLQEAGSKVESIWGDGRVFSDVCLELESSKPARRLIEICPNLKYSFIDSTSVLPNEAGYAALMKSAEVPTFGAFYSSFGMFGHALDESTPMYFEPALDAGAFFEFVPLTGIDETTGQLRPTHQRLWAGNVADNQDYLLLVSNVAGLVAYNTGLVVRVKNTAPLRLRVLGRAESLNGLNERLIDHQVSEIISSFNTAVSRAYKCYVRDYMIGDHVDRGQAVWALELNVDPSSVQPQVLKSLANRLHSELAKTNRNYLKAFDQAGVSAPVVTFLPPGTFIQSSKYPLRHLDTTPDAHFVRKLMTYGGERQIKLRVAKLSG